MKKFIVVILFFANHLMAVEHSPKVKETKEIMQEGSGIPGFEIKGSGFSCFKLETAPTPCGFDSFFPLVEFACVNPEATVPEATIACFRAYAGLLSLFKDTDEKDE